MSESFQSKGDRTIPLPAGRWPLFAIGMATLAACARLLWLVHRYAVNIFFADQWDFLGPLFRGDGLRAFFTLQHGPIREGAGALVIAAGYGLTRWDARSDALSEIAAMLAATACLLAVSRRLFGRRSVFDAIVPLAVLTSAAFEILVLTPNPAHGPLPLFLVAAFTRSLFIERAWPRLLAASALAFATIFTGFGLVLAPLVLLVFAVETARRPAERFAWLAGLALALLSLACFFRGYRSQPAAECFQFPDPQPLRYVTFLAALAARSFSIMPRSPAGPVAAALGGLLLVLVPAVAGLRYLRRGDALSRTAFLLSGFSLAFAVSSAVGRSCLGPGAATASRYVPYLSPAIVAGYFLLRDLPAGRVRQGALSFLLLACVLKEAVPERGRHGFLVEIWRGKSAWADCFRRRGEVARCDAETGFRIHPDPEATDLAGKLSFLRAHRLGLFKDDPPPSTAR